MTKPYYVTKYALTEGILISTDASVSDRYLYANVGGYKIQVPPTDWFTSLEEAQKRVFELTLAKIAALKKSLKKYEFYSPKVREWK